MVDSNGRMLTDPRSQEQDGLTNTHIEYQRELENYLASKAEDMLARHLGQGRAIVKVSADINFQMLKEKSEQVSPENKAILAERTTTSSTTTAGGARGPAGRDQQHQSNGGGKRGGGGGGGKRGFQRRSEKNETDYIVSKTTRELEDRMGNVKRLTIAAMVDLAPDADSGRTNMGLADVQEIVKQAIGYHQGRDEIKVSDVKLGVPVPIVEPGEEAGKLQRVQAYVGLARNVSLTVALVVTVGLAILLLARRRPAVARGPTAAETAAEQQRQQQALQRFEELARKDPDKVAGILTALMGSPGTLPAS